MFLLGISVVLDLTPNYLGNAPWFNPPQVDDVLVKIKVGNTHYIL